MPYIGAKCIDQAEEQYSVQRKREYRVKLSFAEDHCSRNRQTTHVGQHPGIGIFHHIFHRPSGEGEAQHRNGRNEHKVGKNLGLAFAQHIICDHSGHRPHIPHE
ncbi:hypothetical protein D3C75_1181740 [compost metagenome]